MRTLRWLAPGALLSLVACSGVDRNALESDAGATATADRGAVAPVDVGSPAANTDAGIPPTPMDAGAVTPPPPPLDAGAVTPPPPPPDAGTVTPPPPPVDAGTVTPPPRDAGAPPPVDAGSCRACTAFAPVAFCPMPGAGACVPYAGCTADGCATCASALAGGDNCSNPIVISAAGQRRTVVSTCGARDDLDTACGRNGPDVVVALQVARRGRVVTRVTVPAGVTVNFGYDYMTGGCRAERFGRPCNNTGASTTQGFDLTLDAGTLYLYVVTSAPSTIVVETVLP